MRWKRSSRPRALLRAPAWTAVCILIAAVALATMGCAGELPVPGKNSSTSTGRVSTTTRESTPLQLGTQVAATWSEAMQKLVSLLAETPPIASLQAPVTQLKEEYVQKMVALGHQIEALDAPQRQTASDRSSEILDGTADSDWFQSYVRLYDHYAAGEDQSSQDFAVLLSTFNTLTQYAFFDLLKAQDPDEAQRLGIQ
jgi:hypothetical protein